MSYEVYYHAYIYYLSYIDTMYNNIDRYQFFAVVILF